MLHMVFGLAGCGKSTRLMAEVGRASHAVVRTLVPEQFAFTYDQRLYGMLGARAFNRIHTGSFRSVTSEILSEVAENPRDAVDEVVKTVALHRILRRLSAANALRYYGRSAENPAFLTEISAQLNELMQSGSTPEQLAEASAATEGALSEKLLDLARVYAEYLDDLSARGLRDALCDIASAAHAADGTAYFCGDAIFLDEFESFTGDELRMMEVMLRDAADVWIALRTENPDQPAHSRFDAVNTTARRLRRMAADLCIPFECVNCEVQYRYAETSLAHLSRHLYTGAKHMYEGTSAVTIAESRDMTLEAEYTAAQIYRLLMEGDVHCRDIMVVTHDLERYAALLQGAFTRYGIPYYMDDRRSVLHTAVMKLPLCLLALVRKTQTEQILLLLKTQLTPLHPGEAAELENYAYTWDIEGEQWEKPFAAETDPDGKYEKIRQKLIPPLLTFRREAKHADGAELCMALYRCIERMEIPMRVGGLASRMKDDGDVQAGRALRKLWNRFTELLDAMHEALAETPMTPQQLSDLLTTVLRTDCISVPPQTLDAVTVQSAAAARYDAPKIVFVLGVNEGDFPADISPCGFFTEQERTLLCEHGIELSRSVRELCADERLIVYKTLSAPSNRLWLCYPLANESGGSLLPSALLEDVRTLLPKTPVVQTDRLGVAFYVTTKAAAYYSFVQDYTTSPAERETVRAMLAELPGESARLERLRRFSDPAALRVTKPALMRRLTGDSLAMSATFLENLIECPFKGFCKNGLRLYVREKKDLNGREIGNLVHSCMERLFREHPRREDFLAMTDADLRAHAAHCAEDFLQQALGGAENRQARFMMHYRRMTDRMLRLLRHTQEEMRQSQFEPAACELQIGRLGGTEGDIAPYRIELAGGITLTLNGKIDRVDVCEQDGKQYLRIVDYKTNQNPKVFDLADIYYGLNLQMLLYLFALLDDDKSYPDALPAGVLYMPAAAPKFEHDRSKPETLNDYVNEYFRMSGTVLCDRGILSKMEREIAGVYIPAELAKDDPREGELILTEKSSVFTPNQLKKLRAYIESLVKEAAASYTAGDVAPQPMRKKEDSEGDSTKGYYADACKYCDYRGMCGMTDQHKERIRLPEKQKIVREKMRAILNSGEEVQENA